MQKVYERCCGIDVHKKMIACCLKRGRKQEHRQFGTMTKDILELTAWLQSEQCQMIAMESTGSYWKPLYNIFEISGLEAIVVNAAHMKALPGRKTDASDAEWLADLLQHGLLKASFIPNREQRELREIARYRKSLTEERARELNRLQKLLEGANIKLASVASNINGKTSRRLLDLICEDEEITAEVVAGKVHVSMMGKLDELVLSVQGVVTPLQKELIAMVRNHIDDMTTRLAEINDLIKRYIGAYEDAIASLLPVPGIARMSAEVIVAEIGKDMNRFPSAAHLASWAGICPGNNESAGKRKNGNTRRANKTLKAALVQCAWAAIRHTDSFFYAQYQRLVVRRGKKKAIIAVAHSLLIAIYHVLSGKSFQDLGADYYTQFNREKKVNSYLRQLKKLGWEPPAPVTAI
jgi:transposase